jgi:hypothetical protein
MFIYAKVTPEAHVGDDKFEKYFNARDKYLVLSFDGEFAFVLDDSNRPRIINLRNIEVVEISEKLPQIVSLDKYRAMNNGSTGESKSDVKPVPAVKVDVSKKKSVDSAVDLSNSIGGKKEQVPANVE